MRPHRRSTMRYRWLLVIALVVTFAVSFVPDARPALAATSTTVDSAGDVGYWNSIAILNGRPIIAYVDATNADLKVVRCGTPNCTSGNTFSVVDSAGYVGKYPSIAILPNGLPVITYHDGFNY